jgi:RNA polymerase sigma-70 factor (ECF subfamily)
VTGEFGNDGAAPPVDAAERRRRWELVLPHEQRLRRIALRRLASRDEVDDVVQEAMLRAVTFERLDPDYAGQFLTSVTVRLCADVQRDRVRQLRVGVRDALSTVEPHDPHEAVLDVAEARWLYAECLKLPPRESAVVLARANGLSVRVVAGSLGLGMKTAEAALTQARCRIRRSVRAAGSLVALLRRGRRFAAASALLAASGSVLYIGGVVDPLERRAPAPRPYAAAPLTVTFTPGEVVRRVPRPATVAADPARTGDAGTTGARTPAVRVRAPRYVPEKRTVVLRTDPVGPEGPAQVPGTTTERRYEDEPWEQSIQRCLSNPSLDPATLVCNPDA